MATAKKAAKTGRRQKQTPKPIELLQTELREIYSAETQLTRVLPRFSKAIQSQNLRRLMDRRLEQAQQLVEELDAVLEDLDSSPGRKKNAAAEGLIADAQEHLQELEQGPALDAVLIGSVQKLEHYCIAAWGTARSFAQLLEVDNAAQALQRAIEDGKALDEELTQLAEEEINPMMLEGEGDDEDMEPPGRGKSRGGGEARA